MVEESLDLPLHAAQQLAVAAGVLGLDGLRRVHDRLVVALVDGLLDIELAVVMGSQRDLGAPGRQQAERLMMEAVRPVGLAGLAVPLIGNTAGKQQHRDLLFRLLEGEGVALFHQQQADVHLGAHVVHGGIDIGVVPVLQFSIFVKIGHWKHLLF